MKQDRKIGPAKSHVSRRDFLKGSGAAAAATALATSPGLTAAEAGGAQVVGPEMTSIALSVNGRDHSVQVEPRMTLLEVLRYQLNLTGAKPISTSGSSGGSTVLIDGKPMAASTILALQCLGKKIETVESLGGDRPDEVPLAFVSNDAQQCGFCTPGFVVATRAFVDEHPKASLEDVKKGLGGNICRCGTYAGITACALEIAKKGGV